MCDTIPNPGKIRIYTSGCPKNQNKCWYKIGSPPPAGSKNEVLKFLSVNNIVIAPANTGNDNKSKTAVMKTAQTNNGNLWNVIPGVLILIIVVMKFIAPKIDEIPAKCRLNIAKSIEPPEWKSIDANGG
jgi:hypothetical protein